MSLAVMAAVWESDVQPVNARLVLLAVADNANSAGVCWPGTENVVGKSGLSRATVFRMLSKLEEDNLVQRQQRRRDDGGQAATIYRINLAELTRRKRSLTRAEAAELDQIEATPPSHSETPPVSLCDGPRLTAETHKEELEPSLEPTEGASTSATPDGDADNEVRAPLLEAGVGGEPSQEETERADVDELCLLLSACVKKNGAREPKITKAWRDAARLLLDRDQIPLAQAKYVLQWCQRDEFWRTNILSMPTFRKQYDKLAMRAKQEWTQGRQRTGSGAGVQRRACRDGAGEEVLIGGRWQLDPSSLPADDWRRFSQQ